MMGYAGEATKIQSAQASVEEVNAGTLAVETILHALENEVKSFKDSAAAYVNNLTS